MVTVDEDFSDKGGWKITSSVNAVEKLIAYNNNVRSAADNKVVTKKGSKDESPEPPPKIATTTLLPPHSSHWADVPTPHLPHPSLLVFGYARLVREEVDSCQLQSERHHSR